MLQNISFDFTNKVMKVIEDTLNNLFKDDLRNKDVEEYSQKLKKENLIEIPTICKNELNPDFGKQFSLTPNELRRYFEGIGPFFSEGPQQIQLVVYQIPFKGNKRLLEAILQESLTAGYYVQHRDVRRLEYCINEQNRMIEMKYFTSSRINNPENLAKIEDSLLSLISQLEENLKIVGEDISEFNEHLENTIKSLIQKRLKYFES